MATVLLPPSYSLIASVMGVACCVLAGIGPAAGTLLLMREAGPAISGPLAVAAAIVGVGIYLVTGGVVGTIVGRY